MYFIVINLGWIVIFYFFMIFVCNNDIFESKVVKCFKENYGRKIKGKFVD